MAAEMRKQEDPTTSLRAIIDDIMRRKHPATVEELADFVMAERPVDEGDLIQAIQSMAGDGTLTLRKSPYFVESILDYLLTPTLSAWFWSSTGLTILAVISVFIAPDLFPLTIARWVFGALLVLFLPGYALVEFLFPIQKDLNNLERFTFSVALSLCLSVLIGLVINFLPGLGLRLEPIVASLSLFTFIFSTLAMVRKFFNIRVAEG